MDRLLGGRRADVQEHVVPHHSAVEEQSNKPVNRHIQQQQPRPPEVFRVRDAAVTGPGGQASGQPRNSNLIRDFVT